MGTTQMENSAFWQTLDALIAGSEIVIDRPKGSKHPRHDFVYVMDYGYLKNTCSPDGNEIDVWRGTAEGIGCDAIVCTVDLCKRDSEIKILLNCTEVEKETVMAFHNGSEAMKGIMIRRPMELL